MKHTTTGTKQRVWWRDNSSLVSTRLTGGWCHMMLPQCAGHFCTEQVAVLCIRENLGNKVWHW